MGLNRFAMKLFIYKWKYLHDNLHNMQNVKSSFQTFMSTLAKIYELLPLSSENLFLMLYKIFLGASRNKRTCTVYP